MFAGRRRAGRALPTMRQVRVRRLPVVVPGGAVAGIVSINDILLAAGADKAVGSEEVVATLQAICAPQRPRHQVTAA